MRPWIALVATIGIGTTARAEGREDHHHPPADYAAPGWDLPPVSDEAPEYPLAAQFIPASTSNYVAGGMGTVQYVVVHTMQGSYEGSINWFQNPDAQVSAHFCVRSSDGEITQMVHLADRAWHVGTQNSWSIGIEHEGFVDDASWYTFAMYSRSAELARWLADHFGLPLDRQHILGHVELPDQTHTDPGPNWNWDLYMALVHDIVGGGQIDGVVVDRSKTCTLTASVDTFLKATIEDAGALGDDAKCAVPAGTQIAYVHADGVIYGHWRLAIEGETPCSGALAESAYAVAADWDAPCAPETSAATGATVALDGGTPVAVGADGRFSITDVGAGAHAIDASAPETIASNVPFDHAGYPGTRLVIRLDPIEMPGGSSSDGGGTDEGGGEAEGGTTPDPTDASGTSDGGDPADGGDDEDALPDTFGEHETDSGCACTGGPGAAGRDRGWALAFAGFVLFAGARRRRSRAGR
jgi:MYXO-CTERM domain-containing protein